MEIKYGLISSDSHGQLGKDAYTSRMSRVQWATGFLTLSNSWKRDSIILWSGGLSTVRFRGGMSATVFEVDDLESFTENLRAAGFPAEIDSKSDKDSDYRVQDPDGRWVDLAVKRRWPK